MRRYLVTVLASAFVLASLVAGCARTEPGTPSAGATAGPAATMPGDFTATIEYGNGTVPPPYHFEWRLRVTESDAELSWRPGYQEDAPVWKETVPVDRAGREQLYERLRTAGAFDPAPAEEPGLAGGSSGSVEVVADGRTYETGQLSSSREGQEVIDELRTAAHELVPVRVWDGMQDKHDAWSAENPE